MNKRFRSLLAIPLVAALGCAANKKPASAAAEKDKPAPAETARDDRSTVPSFTHDARQAMRDARPEPVLLVHLDVYKLLVPRRAVSHNDEFWKHVDEHAVDVGTYELLFSNGLRVGVAPRDDWDYFKKSLEGNTVVTQVSGTQGVGPTTVQMPLKQDLPEEVVFYFHPIKGLVGQAFDRCDELMEIAFEPVPRQPGDVKVTVTPLFRALRKELAFTARNNVHELDFVRHEDKFDLKLEAVVPLNNFLVIAPSPDADRETSFGRKLLRSEANGQEFEQVLLISPQPFQFDHPTTQPAAAVAQQTPGMK